MTVQYVLRCLTLALIPPFAAPALLADAPKKVKAADIRPERELIITDPRVLDSEYSKYPGPWSFGALMEELAGKESAPKAVADWLENYRVPCKVSDVSEMVPKDWKIRTVSAGSWTVAKNEARDIPARSKIEQLIIRPWQKRDGYDPECQEGWQPNMANAPFRLLAIVNRMDLGAPALVRTEDNLRLKWEHQGKLEQLEKMLGLTRNGKFQAPPQFGIFPVSMRYGNASPIACAPNPIPGLGEGRLVFGAVDQNGKPLAGGWTIIFEYNLPSNAPFVDGNAPVRGDAIKSWAEAWHSLADIDPGDQRFADRLSQITRHFTHVQLGGAAMAPGLAQLRSSEACFGPGREFRQFSGPGLVPQGLPLTPGVHTMDNHRDGGGMLSAFLRATDPVIRAGIHLVPKEVELNGRTMPLLASHAVIPEGEADFHWDPKPAAPRDARRIFSMATCNGCHAGETGCTDGLHIHPRAAGEVAVLSKFLTPGTLKVQDPGNRATTVQLEELKDRAVILAAMLEPREKRRLDALEELLAKRLRRSH